MTRDEMDAAIREAITKLDGGKIPEIIWSGERIAFIAGMRASANIASEWEYGSTADEQIRKAADQLEKAP